MVFMDMDMMFEYIDVLCIGVWINMFMCWFTYGLVFIHAIGASQVLH